MTSVVLAWGAASCFLGFAATMAALIVRWPLVRQLGSAYFSRFLVVQGLAINLALFGVMTWAAGYFGWLGLLQSWVGPPLYALIYFAYSLNNVDFTARKYHGVGDDPAPAAGP